MSASLIALGSNLGDPEKQIDRAVELLNGTADFRVVRRSRNYRTRAIGGASGQPDFLNAVIYAETGLGPQELFGALKRVEDQLQRLRNQRWGPRTIDLDLLLYDDLILESSELMIPHPRLAFRRFVLEPAAEIAGEMIHAPTRWTIGELLRRLDESLPWVAITGTRRDRCREFAREAALLAGCRYLADPVADAFEAQAFAAPQESDIPAQMAFVRERSIAIQQCIATSGMGLEATIVTDFAMIESLAMVRRVPMGRERTTWEEFWNSLPWQQRFPKLLVWLQDENRSDDPVTGGWAAYLAQLSKAANEPRQAPVLRAEYPGTTNNPPEQLVMEIVAAIEAMQPGTVRPEIREGST